VALANVTGTNRNNLTITAAPISNGKATLKVWKVTGTETTGGNFGNFDGNNTGFELYVYIYSRQTFTMQNDVPDRYAKGTVNFSNGNGTVNVSSWTFN
jgi:hypothetical protein